MPSTLQVAVIGAGPYGLSIAAHLAEAGIEHRVFGVPMESWRSNMPPGMLLKSYGESSSLYDARGQLPLDAYCRERGVAYDAQRIPVGLDTFTAYGLEFQKRFVPSLETKRLASLRATNAGHELEFDDGERFTARHVVLAIGVMPYRHISPVLEKLPAELLSHSSRFGPLEGLAGKAVTIVGCGSSALDLAALLSRQGTAVTVLSRSREVHYQTPPGPQASLLRRALRPASNGLGEGWLMCLCASAPGVFRLFPDSFRRSVLEEVLGPSGGYFIREQVEGHVTVKTGRAIESATEQGGRARLVAVGPAGERETIDSDHVIAATGYRVDLQRLQFLDGGARERIRTADGSPVLSADFESTLAGLYFVGLTSARTFGPVMRFVVGAVFPARRLARRFGGLGASRPGSALSPVQG